MFPRIESPCPLQSIQFPTQGNFNCSACKREVHDLSAMNREEREVFLRSCSGKICVSYKVKASIKTLQKGAIAGLFVVGASGVALPAAAQVGDHLNENVEDMVMVGGVKLPENTKHAHEVLTQPSIEDTIQLIPVVEENDDTELEKLDKKKTKNNDKI